MEVKIVCSDGGLRKIDLQKQKLTLNDAIHQQWPKKRMFAQIGRCIVILPRPE
jgi:hypothetical protein